MILKKKQAVTTPSLFACSMLLLLLFANGAHGGTYQRTDDRKARVWSDHPGRGEKASWSGDRDAAGYATGPGTITWFKIEAPVVTGSNIPASRRERVVVISRYSGNMVRGKLEGVVVNVDNTKGTTFHALFANGSRVDDWAPGPVPTATPDRRHYRRAEEVPVVAESVHEPRPTPDQGRDEHAQEGSVAAASNQEPKPTPDQQRDQPAQERLVAESSAKGPKATPDQRRDQPAHGSAVVEAPTQGSASLELGRPPSTLRMPVAAVASSQAAVSAPASSPSSNAAGVDPTIESRIIADFKDETQSVLSRVSDATGNFREIDRLDSVQKLPAPVSERVGSLVERARDFRAKLGYEAGALQQCRTETETVDALSVVDQITRTAASDASAVNSRIANFLKNNPDPTADSEKPLWRYLTAMRSLCSRLEKDADMHLQRAQSLASTGKTGDAIREYQEAYRTCPNPATAEKIRHLQNNSPGL